MVEDVTALQKAQLQQQCQVGIHAMAYHCVVQRQLGQTHLAAGSQSHAVGPHAGAVPVLPPTCNTMLISVLLTPAP